MMKCLSFRIFLMIGQSKWPITKKKEEEKKKNPKIFVFWDARQSNNMNCNKYPSFYKVLSKDDDGKKF